MRAPLVVKCDRCGGLAELPTEMVVILAAHHAKTVVAICQDCVHLRMVNRKMFEQDGWRPKKKPLE